MRSAIRVVRLLLLTSAALIAVGDLPAQSITPCVRSTTFGIQREIFIGGRNNSRAAYTATIKLTYERTLADGNTIRWTSESVQARDENGRTFHQRIEGCETDASGQPQLRMQVDVYDPVAKATTHWNTGPGSMALVTINHVRSFNPPDWKDIPRTPSTPYRPQSTREDLGTRTIAGVEANGSRTTEIVPASVEGNDTPLKIVHEMWEDRQNHTILVATDDDPRNGRYTWEVENLAVGPPDPALFTPPTNYKVWDDNPQPQTSADAKP
jgi:hypothetical protein